MDNNSSKGTSKKSFQPIKDDELALMKSHMPVTHVKCAKGIVSGAALAHPRSLL